MKGVVLQSHIVWIADDEIVDLSENLSVPSGNDIVRVKPKREVNYVLEVSAGFVATNKVKVGDVVSIDKW